MFSSKYPSPRKMSPPPSQRTYNLRRSSSTSTNNSNAARGRALGRNARRVIGVGLLALFLVLCGWAVSRMRTTSSKSIPVESHSGEASGSKSRVYPGAAVWPAPPSQQRPDSFNGVLSSTKRVKLPSPRSSGKGSSSHSFFRCVGNENDIDGFRDRVCVFENLCYNIADRVFNYYANPLLHPSINGQSRSPTVLFDSKWGERVDFNEAGHGFVALHQTTDIFGADMSNTWGPNVVVGSGVFPNVSDPKNTITVSGLHALWSLWAYDDNLGHMLWEEMSGIFFAMARMGVMTDELVAMHYPEPLPDRPLSIKFRNAFFPAISKTAPVHFQTHLSNILAQYAAQTPNPSHICFDNILVGGNMRRFLHKDSWHNFGHEPLFKLLRARILKHHGLDPTFTPSKHKILVTNKTETNFKHDETVGSRKRAIYNLDQVMDSIRKRYPGVDVQAIEWQKFSVVEQLNIMLETTVFITPPGGVSMMLPFLPEGAHAIIMDYYEREEPNWYGTRKDESISMEAPFWNHWPHVKKLYYQIRGAHDLVSDSESKVVEEVNWREGVSYNLDLDRILSLVDQAFDGME
ncbi:hypothetical protein HDU81_007083 [Chytriomyces hyalinus]|nr:hypothetical protein HDU81_007083 [Chytriomyces hyalinus]